MTAALTIDPVVVTDRAARSTLTLACAAAVDAATIAERAGRVLRTVFPEAGAPQIVIDDGEDHRAILNDTSALLVAIAGPHRFTLEVSGDLADGVSLELLADSVLGTSDMSATPERIVNIGAWRAGFGEDASARAVEARSWWHERIHPSPVLPFATDDGEGCGADPACHVVPPALAAAVHALAERNGWRPETPWLAAWSVVVSALADAPCTVWADCDGRGFEGLAGCVGALAHPLPLSWPLDPGADAQTLLARIDADLTFAQDRQDYAPQPQAGVIGFRWHRAVALVDRDGREWIEVSRGEAGPAAAPCLEILAQGRTVRLRLHGPVAGQDADRVVNLVVAFLQALAVDPWQAWEALLPPGSPNPPSPRRADRDILTDIARWVEHSPEATAVVDEFDSLSYTQMWRRAGAVASRLRALGAGPERPVGLVAGRSVAAAVALIGAWRAGAPYLPLDPTHPDARLSRLLDAARVVAIVADPAWGARAESWGRPIVLATDEEAEPLQGAGDEVPCAATAYLIATSGSTGAPKLVAIERRQLAAYRDALVETIAAGDGRRYAMVTGWATDLGLTMLVAALTTGGALHMLPSAALLQAPAFAAFVQGHDIEILKMTPGHLAGLLAQPGGTGVLPSRLVVLGGEPLPGALVAAIAAARPNLAIWNHYGPTETTIGCIAGRVDVGRESWSGAPPLGRPLAGAAVTVRDALGRPACDWLPGEIWIEGATVARGYAGAAAETAAAFVPAEAGLRAYPSGDRARRLPDGRIVYLGRRDFQVKIAGYRVDPGEVEAALRGLPAIAGVVVAARSGRGREPRLVAYVVPGVGVGFDPTGWRRALADVLPPHALPAAFVAMAAIPLGDNGKPDRARLPDPPADAPAALDPMEAQVAAIWAELLGVANIAPDDRFFDIGGHSLQMVALHQLIVERLAVEVTLIDLFANPTVRAIAGLARGVGRDDVATAAKQRGERQRHALAGLSRRHREGRRL